MNPAPIDDGLSATSTGRGSDLMIPMAVPIFGGMMIELITMFVVPVLFSAWKEQAVK